MSEIRSIEGIRSAIGEPGAYASKKIYRYLNNRMTDFLSRSRVVFITSVGADGFPTVSPRGDASGFLKIEDSQTLLIPERKGNKLAFTLQNLIENDKVGLICIVPNTSETLRIKGTARVLNDNKLNAEMASSTQKALLVIEIKVLEAYFHCAKSLIRSEIWKPDTWDVPLKISFGSEIAENVGASEGLAEELDAGVNRRYETDL